MSQKKEQRSLVCDIGRDEWNPMNQPLTPSAQLSSKLFSKVVAKKAKASTFLATPKAPPTIDFPKKVSKRESDSKSKLASVLSKTTIADIEPEPLSLKKSKDPTDFNSNIISNFTLLMGSKEKTTSSSKQILSAIASRSTQPNCASEERSESSGILQPQLGREAPEAPRNKKGKTILFETSGTISSKDQQILKPRKASATKSEATKLHLIVSSLQAEITRLKLKHVRIVGSYCAMVENLKEELNYAREELNRLKEERCELAEGVTFCGEVGEQSETTEELQTKLIPFNQPNTLREIKSQEEISKETHQFPPKYTEQELDQSLSGFSEDTDMMNSQISLSKMSQSPKKLNCSKEGPVNVFSKKAASGLRLDPEMISASKKKDNAKTMTIELFPITPSSTKARSSETDSRVSNLLKSLTQKNTEPRQKKTDVCAAFARKAPSSHVIQVLYSSEIPREPASSKKKDNKMPSE